MARLPPTHAGETAVQVDAVRPGATEARFGRIQPTLALYPMSLMGLVRQHSMLMAATSLVFTASRYHKNQHTLMTVMLRTRHEVR